MLVTNIETLAIDMAWFQSIKAVMENGRVYKVDGGIFDGINRRELDYVTIHIKSPAIFPSIGEPFNYKEGYLPSGLISGKFEKAQKSYIEYLEPQIKHIISTYKIGGPNNNQMVMSIGDGTFNPASNPCLRLVDTRVSEGKLHFIAYFRSWDLWAGFPYDVQALQGIKYKMAEDIGVEDGELILSSKGLHLYEYTWPIAQIIEDLINARKSN